MKAYVRQNKPSKAYFAEMERALKEGFAAGIAHAMFMLHLNNGFGKSRLEDLAEVMSETLGNSKGRYTDLKAEIEFLNSNYNIDVTKIKPAFEIRRETIAERNERLKSDKA